MPEYIIPDWWEPSMGAYEPPAYEQRKRAAAAEAEALRGRALLPPESRGVHDHYTLAGMAYVPAAERAD